MTDRALEESDPVDVRDFYKERASILEFDGELPRSDAEHQALAETAAALGLSVDQVRQAIEAAGGYEP
jgi:hypothetical protein